MTDPSKYLLNHTNIRIKDPKRSLQFYESLGLQKIKQLDFPDEQFSLYFLAYDSPQSVSKGSHWTNRQGLVELLHKYGSESDSDFIVTSGNSDPGRGYGHVGITVDNIQAACAQFKKSGIKFQETLEEGLPILAFILDPDGYWIEIFGQKSLEETKDAVSTDNKLYRLNHTMIRVKDPKVSLPYYQNILGMEHVNTIESPGGAPFTLYFLAYKNSMKGKSIPDCEGLLELWWDHGTELNPDYKLHNGNEPPMGFSHLCISVDHLEEACRRFEKEGVEFQKRLEDGKVKDIAFILDPDGYWIEVLQNQEIKRTLDW